MTTNTLNIFEQTVVWKYGFLQNPVAKHNLVQFEEKKNLF